MRCMVNEIDELSGARIRLIGLLPIGKRHHRNTPTIGNLIQNVGSLGTLSSKQVGEHIRTVRRAVFVRYSAP